MKHGICAGFARRTAHQAGPNDTFQLKPTFHPLHRNGACWSTPAQANAVLWDVVATRLPRCERQDLEKAAFVIAGACHVRARPLG
jgi:hypothetical protein